MAGLLDAMQGFAVIGIVIAVGYVAARMRVGGSQAQMVLNRMSFFVATPCLIFSILSRERLATLLHPSFGFTPSQKSAFSCLTATRTYFFAL